MVDNSADEIIAQLERITSSPTFASSPRLIQFLRFCVQTALQGNADQLKESTIGVSVFGRAPGYDPRIDPIVRVHARRLRDKLDSFYKSEGRGGQIRVQIHKGGYVPQFDRVVAVPEDVCASAHPAAPPVNTSGQNLAAEMPVASADPSSHLHRSPLWRGIVAVAICCSILLLLARLRNPVASASGSSAASADSAKNDVFPLTPLPGSERDPSWSPDGTSFAFAWARSAHEQPHIYTTSVSGGSPTPLTSGPKAEMRPVWAPDGREMAFLRQQSDTEYQVVLLDLQSHTERVLYTQRFESVLPGELPALDWSPDGHWIVTSEQQPSEPAHLMLLSVADGHPHQITDPPNASTGDIEARFSPDSRQIAFRRGGVGDLWLVSLRGSGASSAQPLTTDNPGVRGLCWSASGRSIFFGAMRDANIFSIWKMPLDGSPLTRITPPGVQAVSPALEPGGSRLAFVQPNVDVNIWRYQTASPAHSTVFNASTRRDFQPAFSADGKQVAFISDRSGPTEVWVANVDGTSARKVTSLDGNGLPFQPSWSTDGTSIVFFCRRDGRNYAIQVSSQGSRETILRGGADYTLEPQFSRDGRTLFYTSNAGNRFRVWRAALNEQATAAEVTDEDAEFFQLSRSGNSLYYLRGGAQQQLVEQDLATNEKRVIWTWRHEAPMRAGWAIAADKLFFLRHSSGAPGNEVVCVDLRTGRETALGMADSIGWESGIAASPDGASVLVSQADRDEAEVMYVRIAASGPGAR